MQVAKVLISKSNTFKRVKLEGNEFLTQGFRRDRILIILLFLKMESMKSRRFKLNCVYKFEATLYPAPFP